MFFSTLARAKLLSIVTHGVFWLKELAREERNGNIPISSWKSSTFFRFVWSIFVFRYMNFVCTLWPATSLKFGKTDPSSPLSLLFSLCALFHRLEDIKERNEVGRKYTHKQWECISGCPCLEIWKLLTPSLTFRYVPLIALLHRNFFRSPLVLSALHCRTIVKQWGCTRHTILYTNRDHDRDSKRNRRWRLNVCMPIITDYPTWTPSQHQCDLAQHLNAGIIIAAWMVYVHKTDVLHMLLETVHY